MDLFNEVSLRIISTLYSSFPEPTHLDPAVLGMLEDTSYRDEAGGVIYSDEWAELDQFITHTARWLSDEGYLSKRQSHSHFSSTYTLSSLGLKCIKGVDQPNIGQPTVGEKLKEGGVAAAKATASKFMEQFLAAGTAILFKAADLG